MVRGFLALAFVAAVLSACEIPDEPFRAVAYSEIVRAQMAAGDSAGARRTVELALQAVDEDDDKSSRDFTIAAAAVAQVRFGDLAGAEEMQWRASNPGENGFILFVLALALDEAGHKSAASRNAGMSSVIAGALQPEKAGDRGLALVAWIVARSGDTVGPRHIEKRIADADIRDEATALIARGQAEAGDATGALTTLERIRSPVSKGGDVSGGVMIARGMAIDVYDVFDDFVTYPGRTQQKNAAWLVTALSFAKSGDLEAARRTFDGAIDAANAIPNLADRIKLLAATGLAQAEAGDRKAARATLDYADTVHLQAGSDAGEVSANAIRMIDAARFAVDGQPDFVGVTEHADLNESVKFLILTAIFQIRLNNLAGAAANLDWLKERASGLRDASIVVAALGRLAIARFETGDTTAARERVTQALEIAHGIPKTDDERIVAMFFASVALARIGFIEEALSAAAEIQEREQPAQ